MEIIGIKKCVFAGILVVLGIILSDCEHNVKKRFILLAPRTTVLQLTYGVAVPVVLRNKRQFVIDNAWQQNFDLPFNLSNFRVATYYARSVVDTIDITRETLYVYLMNTLDNLELDGEQCLLRSVCEVAHTPFHVRRRNSILEKIAQFIFTPSRRYNFDKQLQEERGMNNLTFGQSLLYAQDVGLQRRNCSDIFSKCIISIVDLMSKKFVLE